MKSHIPRVLWVLLVVAVGCDNQDIVKREHERQETLRSMKEGMLKTRQRAEALREQLKRGLQPVVDCALERFRREVEYKYGAGAVKQAKITAEASKLKGFDEEEQEIGGDTWEVTIRYVGKDENGKDVDTQWVAVVDLFMGQLVCVSVKRK
jgi:hypothetical protein